MYAPKMSMNKLQEICQTLGCSNSSGRAKTFEALI
jgi:hypothetical protein